MLVGLIHLLLGELQLVREVEGVREGALVAEIIGPGKKSVHFQFYRGLIIASQEVHKVYSLSY